MSSDKLDSTSREDARAPPRRDETEGRGQGTGTWLEKEVSDTLEEWGYRTEPGEHLLGLEVDVVGQREQLQNEPEDFIVAECKDWNSTYIGEDVIIRLCLVAFTGRAMPLLVHTTKLTDRAWNLAQLFDVRLLSYEELRHYDGLPPLTVRRPAYLKRRHRNDTKITNLRSYPPTILWRRGLQGIEAPVFQGAGSGPCYVTDRDGHNDYVYSYETDFDYSTRP